MEQKKRISIISIVVVLIILIVAGIFFAFSYINNPKVILSNIVDKTLNEFSDVLLKNAIIGTQPLSADGNMTLKTNLDLTSVLGTKVDIEDLTLKWKSQTDPSKKMESLNTDLNYNKQNLFNCDLITKDDKGYIYVKNLLEDYYMFTITKQDQNLVVDKLLIKSLNKLMEASLKDEKFVTTKEDITLGKDTISTNKHVLTIDESNVTRIVKYGAEYIKTDNYLLEKIAANSEITKEEIIKSLDDFIIPDDSYIGTDKVDIYFNTNNFAKIYRFGININDQVNINSSKNNNYYETCIDVYGSNLVKINGTSDKTKYDFNLKLTYDNINVTGNVSSQNMKDGLIKINCFESNNEFAKIDGTYIYEVNNEITKFNLDLKPYINKMSIGNINLVLNNEIKKLENVDIKIPTNVIDTENMTAEQKEKFNNAINSLTSMLGIGNLMSGNSIQNNSLNENIYNIEK